MPIIHHLDCKYKYISRDFKGTYWLYDITKRRLSNNTALIPNRPWFLTRLVREVLSKIVGIVGLYQHPLPDSSTLHGNLPRLHRCNCLVSSSLIHQEIRPLIIVLIVYLLNVY